MNELMILTSIGVLCYASFKIGKAYRTFQLIKAGLTPNRLAKVLKEIKEEQE